MAQSYRLCVTLKGCDVILEYRDRRGETWALAGLHSFERPLKAMTAFGRLQNYTAVPNVIRDKFKEWGCEIPAELEEEGVVLVMSEDDFIFSGG